MFHSRAHGVDDINNTTPSQHGTTTSSSYKKYSSLICENYFNARFLFASFCSVVFDIINNIIIINIINEFIMI